MRFPKTEERPESLTDFVLVCVAAGIGTVVGFCVYACYLT